VVLELSFGYLGYAFRKARQTQRLVSLALLTLVGTSALLAQSTTGTVVGTVKDPQGAAVTGAVVNLTNTGTNAKHSTMTNDSGGYQFVNLEVGSYQLTVDAPGFRKAEFKAFDLGGRETKRVDAQVEIASQATTVNVESSYPWPSPPAPRARPAPCRR
jgi:hypothetical protein